MPRGAPPAARPEPEQARRGYADVLALLGLRAPFAHVPSSPLEVHDVLREGLPAASLAHAVERLALLRERPVFEGVMAMSQRTFQRLKESPGRTLDAEASGRLWQFAETFARAADVLGSAEAAERWMATPAIGLNQRRPIDLMSTPAGVGLVRDLLERMDLGVYA
jgi:putative toxin-antitoxin system antitoxin component (TIGR02293 family)